MADSPDKELVEHGFRFIPKFDANGLLSAVRPGRDNPALRSGRANLPYRRNQLLLPQAGRRQAGPDLMLTFT